MVSPSMGSTRRGMGRYRVVVPMLGKVRVRPTMMIAPPTAAASTRSLAENAPQTPSDPTVHGWERRADAVLEISEPTPQRPVHVRDDASQRATVRPFRLHA